jgi:hypothetical protein
VLRARGTLRRVERHRGWTRSIGRPGRRGAAPGLLLRKRPGTQQRSGGPATEPPRGEPETDHGIGRRSRAVEDRKPDSDADQDQKRGEPHDRYQGAINLKSAGRSKPSKPGGTARAERVRRVAAPGRRQQRVERGRASGSQPRDSSAEQRCGWEWTPGMDADGGAISDNPMRGARIRAGTSRGEPKARQSRIRNGGRPREPGRVSQGEAKVTRAGSLVDPTPWRGGAGSPLQTRTVIARRPSKVKEGAWRRPTIRNPHFR